MVLFCRILHFLGFRFLSKSKQILNEIRMNSAHKVGGFCYLRETFAKRNQKLRIRMKCEFYFEIL